MSLKCFDDHSSGSTPKDNTHSNHGPYRYQGRVEATYSLKTESEKENDEIAILFK